MLRRIALLTIGTGLLVEVLVHARAIALVVLLIVVLAWVIDRLASRRR